MHWVEYVLKNKVHKILKYFEIKKNHLISAKRPKIFLLNKKKRACQSQSFK